MLYSQLFPKTQKTAPKDDVSVNAKFLLQGGFVDKLMAGSYTLLPLGRLVERKIEQIIREEMNLVDYQEVLMPLLHPKEVWDSGGKGRWNDPKVKEIMYQFEKNNKEYALSFTHEEIVMDLIGKHTSSYKDFPVKVYHFSTKFRNEPRAKSGLLRAREFIMKDAYSAHVSKEDLEKHYWETADAYKRIFKRIGLKALLVEAAGGVFTEGHTHEFQVLAENGEDITFYCDKCDFAENKEITLVKEGDKCPKCEGKIKIGKSIEVGNIFPLETKYAERMGVSFMDEEGNKKYVWFASYGIGPTRVMGTVVEVLHDDKGVIWPESIAPYQCHLIGLNLENDKVKKMAEEIYNELLKKGVEILYDDRMEQAGAKFADADLIGIPKRIVISAKTLESGKIEFKKRTEKEAKLVEKEELFKILTS